ncbi:hypothetical protein H4R19_002440 [Coemansia spiralis]|nr:hypothetical protein H4R19_002440 [Coemansia spiralis]
MSDEKHVPLMAAPPADLESGSEQRCRRGRSALRKALALFACFFVAQLVLRAAFGGPGLLSRVWSYGCSEAAAHHRPQPWGHGDRHKHPRPKPIHFSGPSKLGSHAHTKMGVRINPKALTALVQGTLPMTHIGDVFKHAEICVPVVPVAGLDKVSFSPSEFGKISHRVAGGVGADIRIVSAPAGDEATFEVTALASSQKIADQISLSATKGSDGDIVLQLDGPKWLGKGDCAYANIVLSIPQAVTALPALRASYVYGSITVDRALARAVSFGDFEIDAALSPISVPPIRADNIIINSVSGGIHGYFHIGKSLSIHSVRSEIDAGVNVRGASEASITAESVTGEIQLRVGGGFDGSFRARTVAADVDVEDISDGSSRLHFDKDLERVKTGTFGPADSSRAGNATLRASTINGQVHIEFV